MKALHLKHWSEISESVKDLNPLLFKFMDAAAKVLKNNYVYEIELPFGMNLITEGRSTLFENEFLVSCDFIGDFKNNNAETFLANFSNKNDHPLSLLESGVTEIYGSNEYNLFEGKLEYNFPLNILKKGELLGTFGATDLICNLQLNKPHYTYSAICGNYCVYPILPRTFKKGTATYIKKMRSLCKEYSLPFKEDQELFSFFQQFLKHWMLNKLPNKTVKLILIPDFWYNNPVPQNAELRGFISKEAWMQSRESLLNNLKVIPVIKEIGSKVSNKNYIISEMIVYLEGISEGKRLAMKPVNTDSYLNEIYVHLNDQLQGIYDPVLFYFDFLEKGEWGIFPLLTFPTLNPIPSVNTAKDLLESLRQGLDSCADYDSLISKVSYYFNPIAFKKEHFPHRNTYTQLFLTRAILKVQRS